MIDTILDTSNASDTLIAALLRRGAPCDWRLGKIRFPRGQFKDRCAAIKHAWKLWSRVFCKAAPQIYPKDKWTGYLVSLRDVGLMHCVCGFLEDTITDYMKTYHPEGLRHVPPIYTYAGDAGDVAVLDTEGGESADTVDAAASGHKPAADPTEGDTWVSRNRKARSQTIALARNTTPMDTVLLTKVVNPMQHYCYDELEVNSLEWQARSNCTIAATEGTYGDVALGLLGNIEWPLIRVSMGKADRECLRVWETLHSSSEYDCMPEVYNTLCFRHRVFKYLSRSSVFPTRILLCYTSCHLI